MNNTINAIAKKYLHLETLETHKSDDLDFSNQSVWCIKSALEDAYKAGGWVKIRFARKPSDMHEVLSAAKDTEGSSYIGRIIEHRRLNEQEYNNLTNNFMGNYPWMEGKGGSDNEFFRDVIKITCPSKLTLFIDPSGAFYARYVGLEV